MIVRALVTVSILAFSAPSTFAAVQLSIEGAHAASGGGGCFYVVARPDGNESIQGIDLQLALNGIAINSFDSRYVFPSSSSVLTEWYQGDLGWAALDTAVDFHYALTENFVIGFAGGQPTADPTPAGAPFVLGQFSYDVVGGSPSVEIVDGTDAAAGANAGTGLSLSPSATPATVIIPANPFALLGAGVHGGLCNNFDVAVAVPEPSSFLFLGLIVVACGATAKFRKWRNR